MPKKASWTPKTALWKNVSNFFGTLKNQILSIVFISGLDDFLDDIAFVSNVPKAAP